MEFHYEYPEVLFQLGNVVHSPKKTFHLGAHFFPLSESHKAIFDMKFHYSNMKFHYSTLKFQCSVDQPRQ